MPSLKIEVKSTVRLETQLAERAQLKQALAEAEKAMKRWEAKYDAEVRSAILKEGVEEHDVDGTTRYRLQVGPFNAVLTDAERSTINATKLLGLGVGPDVIAEATDKTPILQLRVTIRESEGDPQ